MDTSQYYNQLAGIYDPQKTILQGQIAALQPEYEAQLSGLEQAKVNAYRDIETTARGRGMQFSGFSPEQQARYTGERYLPAVAGLKSQLQGRKSALELAMAELGSSQGLQALNLWRDEQTRRQAAEQFDKELALKREMAVWDRDTARMTRGGSSSKDLTTRDIWGAIGSNLYAVRGGDGYVSPNDYKLAKQDAIEMGMSASDFDDRYANLVNPSHSWEYSDKYKDEKPAATTTKKQDTRSNIRKVYEFFSPLD